MSTLNKVIIKQPFQDQYDLIIELESKMVNSHLISKTKLRHDFNVISCDEKSLECRLVLLDIFLENSNNDLIREVAQVTAAFNRMFNELHLKLSQNGKVLEVLNMDLILSKWNQTKDEMKSAVQQNEELRKLIAINDSLFTNPEKLKLSIQANEFLSVYFGQFFNEIIPNKKTVLGKNLFSTANLDWKYEFNSDIKIHNTIEEILIGTKGMPAGNLSIGFNNAAYSQFKENLNINNLNPQFSEIAEHKISYQNGKVNKAYIKKSEIADENNLFMKLNYTLSADSSKITSNEKYNSEIKSTHSDKRKSFGFFLNENQES